MSDNFEDSRVLKRVPPPPPDMNAASADVVKVLTVWLWDEVHARPITTMKGAQHHAITGAARLRDAGLIPGTGARRDPASMVASFVAKGERPLRGVSHLMAEALVLLHLDEIHIDVVRALLPTTPKARARVNPSMRKFDQWGWISRTQTGTIRVLKPECLTEWFTFADDADERRAETTLDLAAAVEAINRGLEASHSIPDQELRRRELIAIKRLMEAAPGSVTNERGAVRIVPKGSAL